MTTEPTTSVLDLDIDNIRKEIEAKSVDKHKIPNETLDLIFLVETITFAEFAEQCDDLTIGEIKTDPPIDADQELLIFRESSHLSRAFISTKHHLVPYAKDCQIFVEIRSDTGKLFKNGITINIYKDPYGLLTFVPLGSGKKIYGYYFDISLPSFFNVGQCGIDEFFCSVSPPSKERRSLRNKITEIDRIFSSNSSSRFRKLSQNWGVFHDALDDLHIILNKTIDPSYLMKVMLLNQRLSYPPSDNL